MTIRHRRRRQLSDLQLQTSDNEVDMTYNFELQNCNDEDVFSFDSKLVKAGWLRDIIKQAFINCEQLPNLISNSLKQKHGVGILLTGCFNNDGIDCEVLKLGANSWQKGKFRIRVYLCFCNNSMKNEDFELQNCNDEDVFSFDSGLVKVGGLRNIIKYAFTNCEQLSQIENNALEQKYKVGISLNNCLYDDGIDCEILKLGAQNWQIGKIRIRFYLEFCPDSIEFEETFESNKLEINHQESPLDDIRRMINQDSQ